MNPKYPVICLMSLALVLAYIVFSSTSLTLSSIPENHVCSLEAGCPHVAALSQAYLGYGASAAVFLIGLYLFLRPPLARKPRQKPSGLDPDEAKVYDIMEQAGGMLFQSELVEKSGFPKARVTRVLDRLEGKGILERRRRGMTNAVVLK
jgi:uncharacterized membrane protein